jgi:hypothetical protein
MTPLVVTSLFKSLWRTHSRHSALSLILFIACFGLVVVIPISLSLFGGRIHPEPSRKFVSFPCIRWYVIMHASRLVIMDVTHSGVSAGSPHGLF